MLPVGVVEVPGAVEVAECGDAVVAGVAVDVQSQAAALAVQFGDFVVAVVDEVGE